MPNASGLDECVKPCRKQKNVRTGICVDGKELFLMMKRQILALCLMLSAVGTPAQTNVWRSDSLQEVVVTGTGTQHLLKDAPYRQR